MASPKVIVSGAVNTVHLAHNQGGGVMAPAADTLPVNHPQAGYVDPDLSFVDDREDHEDLADEREERVKAREADVKKIAEAEAKVAKAERGAEEEPAPKVQSKSSS